MNSIEKRFKSIPTAEPDEWDLKMLADIEANPDNSKGITLKQMDELRARSDARKNYSGKISVRVPKDLHRELMESAKENGVSLNQFIVYKLAR
ncbi:MAG: type II toxin-antitoxin system HicB family antitoxin [Oscillospiraceae bacterium]|nr:type II toxin-antitoxin system HicB family antitoxin [Oscillospiraceae bacterium]